MAANTLEGYTGASTSRHGISWQGILRQGILRQGLLCHGTFRQGILRQGMGIFWQGRGAVWESAGNPAEWPRCAKHKGLDDRPPLQNCGATLPDRDPTLARSSEVRTQMLLALFQLAPARGGVLLHVTHSKAYKGVNDTYMRVHTRMHSLR